MALNANALTTLANVKEQLDIADASQDSLLERLINTASQLIEKYTDRVLVQDTYTEFYFGRGSNQLMLRNYPAEKPTDLRIDNNAVFDVSAVIDTDDYDIDNGSMVSYVGSFPRASSRHNIKIVYLGGFATIPSDLEHASIELVEFLYERSSDRRIGVTSKSKRDETISFVQGIPEFIALMLDPYVRHEFPNSDSPVRNI